MRRTQWAPTASLFACSLLLLGIAGCSDSTNPGSGNTIPSAEANDIGDAAADEVDQSVNALTVSGAEAGAAVQSSAAQYVVGFTPPGTTCATVDNTTDSDGDGSPDHATFTFALPACSFTGFRGGTLEITGTIELSDPTPSSADFAYQATLTDFQFKFTSPNQTRSYTAVRNGTRALTANAASASLSNNITVVRSYTGRADATVSHNTLLTFTAAEGESLAVGQPLPNGTFVKSGTLIWSRNGVSRTFTVTTVEPLAWDASCTTDRKIASGEIHWTLADGSYIKTVWTGCGIDPTRTFVPVS
jgi:hypothetical protein